MSTLMASAMTVAAAGAAPTPHLRKPTPTAITLSAANAVSSLGVGTPIYVRI